MAIEIELKAWVDDPEATRRAIGSFARAAGTYRKDDAYWRLTTGTEPSGTDQKPEGKPRAVPLGSGIRIRREDVTCPRAMVNFKRKEMRDGIEVNDEREFEVSDAEVFGELLSRLGLSVWIRKRKTGEAWTANGVTIELSEVEGLGYFTELEILAEVDDPETVAEARKRLLATLERIGIGQNKIETRYYTEMLAKRAQG
jgi:adenylate cyclase, class 2